MFLNTIGFYGGQNNDRIRKVRKPKVAFDKAHFNILSTLRSTMMREEDTNAKNVTLQSLLKPLEPLLVNVLRMFT